MTDGVRMREKIISMIKERGPILPVQVAKETGLSILFSSAFLSELYSDKEINISNIRVGSSPLYFIPGQEPQLEKFSQYLKNKEKEAFLLLQNKKILRDAEIQPAIRVALREIKDFAIPFEKNGEIFWRYFLTEEPLEIKTPVIEIKRVEIAEEKPKMEVSEKKEFGEDKLISVSGGRGGMTEPDSEKINIEKEKPKKKTAAKPKKQNKKKDENFFNKIKEYLTKKDFEILDIKDFKNDQAILKVKKGNKEELVFAFNKKKITEKEIILANKKASEEKLPYTIFSLGEASKKLADFISAVQNLSKIEKID